MLVFRSLGSRMVPHLSPCWIRIQIRIEILGWIRFRMKRMWIQEMMAHNISISTVSPTLYFHVALIHFPLMFFSPNGRHRQDLIIVDLIKPRIIIWVHIVHSSMSATYSGQASLPHRVVSPPGPWRRPPPTFRCGLRTLSPGTGILNSTVPSQSPQGLLQCCESVPS
jgi:hypothetical protein